jgi:hypothetical protein
MFVERFKSTTVFGIDLAAILSLSMDDQRLLQEQRASEKLWSALAGCLTGNGEFGQWIDEAPRIVQRMIKAERMGGKEVWQRRFLNRHSPLLLVNHNYGLHVSGRDLPLQSNLDPTGARYRSAYLHGVDYRLTRDGVLVATYEADFSAPPYSIPEVITALTIFREDSFETLKQFIAEFFGDQRRRKLLAKATGLSLRDDPKAEKGNETVAEGAHFHSLVVIEGFSDPSSGGRADIDRVLTSRELAGILNEAAWYAHYSASYCANIAERQFGYRGDEIYVIDRRSTVIVAQRYWDDDPLTYYRLDVQLAIEHHIAGIALLMQQLAFFREYEEVRPVEARDPFQTLPLVLAARSNLTLMHEYLDFTSLVRHGFTRRFARHLRHEMEFERALGALTQRISDMSEAINLKSSVQSARTSLTRASRNNQLQTTAVVLAILALVVAIVTAIITSR